MRSCASWLKKGGGIIQLCLMTAEAIHVTRRCKLLKAFNHRFGLNLIYNENLILSDHDDMKGLITQLLPIKHYYYY